MYFGDGLQLHSGYCGAKNAVDTDKTRTNRPKHNTGTKY